MFACPMKLFSYHISQTYLKIQYMMRYGRKTRCDAYPDLTTIIPSIFYAYLFSVFVVVVVLVTLDLLLVQNSYQETCILFYCYAHGTYITGV